jgi:hypothetical protein
MKMIRIAALALLLLAAAALAGVGRPENAASTAEKPRAGITVTGLGTVNTVPDEAQVSLGVETEGATAKDALAENSSRMERILDALKQAGIDSKDIRTQDVSVSPSYETDEESTRGYTARNSITVKIRDLDRAGAVLDAATRAGANQVYGPTLSSSAREKLQAEALEAAVRNARTKAAALADAAGVDLGDVTGIVEGFDGGPESLYGEALRAADASKAVPIEPGTEEIQATVTVTFAIA